MSLRRRVRRRQGADFMMKPWPTHEDYFIGLETHSPVIEQQAGFGGVFWSLPRLVKYYDYDGNLLQEIPLEPAMVSTPDAIDSPGNYGLHIVIIDGVPTLVPMDPNVTPAQPGHFGGFMWGVTFKQGPNGDIIVVGSEGAVSAIWDRVESDLDNDGFFETVTHVPRSPTAFTYHILTYRPDGSLLWYRSRQPEFGALVFGGLWGGDSNRGNTYRLACLAVSDENIWLGWSGANYTAPAPGNYYVEYLDRWGLDGTFIETVELPEAISRRINRSFSAVIEVGVGGQFLYILTKGADATSELNIYTYDTHSGAFAGPVTIASANFPDWFIDLSDASAAVADPDGPYDVVFNVSFNAYNPDGDPLDMDRQMILVRPGLVPGGDPASVYSVTPVSDDGHRPFDALKADAAGAYAVAQPSPQFGDFAAETPAHGFTDYLLRRANGVWEDVATLPDAARLRAFTPRHPSAPTEVPRPR